MISTFETSGSGSESSFEHDVSTSAAARKQNSSFFIIAVNLVKNDMEILQQAMYGEKYPPERYAPAGARHRMITTHKPQASKIRSLRQVF